MNEYRPKQIKRTKRKVSVNFSGVVRRKYIID